MPAAPTPPLSTGPSMDTATGGGKTSTDTSVHTSFGLSHKNSPISSFTTSRTQKAKSPHVIDSNVPSSNKNAINSLPRGSNSTGKENTNETNSSINSTTKNLSLQSKLSIPVSSTNYADNGYKNSRPNCTELNEFISCILCNGYLIDATTIVECVHSCKYLLSNYLLLF